MSNCQNRRDICITRGDSFLLLVGLAKGWAEIAATPLLYQGRLVVRETQDDDAPVLLSMISAILPGEDPRFEDMDVILEFAALPTETNDLPPYDLACYCEVTSLDGNYVRRLFNGKVKIGD